jgi:hypothetical protein
MFWIFLASYPNNQGGEAMSLNELLYVFIFGLAGLAFLSSLFVHKGSPLCKYESRLGYALRWGTYRCWLVPLHMACGLMVNLCRCVFKGQDWYVLVFDLSFFAQGARLEIDREARNVRLRKQQRRRLT